MAYFIVLLMGLIEMSWPGVVHAQSSAPCQLISINPLNINISISISIDGDCTAIVMVISKGVMEVIAQG